MNAEFVKYIPDMKKLTKSNSLLINNRLFYIVKKDNTGKASKFFVVYDYETKIQLGFFVDKNKIEESLTRIFKKERIYTMLDLFFSKVSK